MDKEYANPADFSSAEALDGAETILVRQAAVTRVAALGDIFPAALSANLAADVALVSSGVWYDGPSLLLGPGVWLLIGRVNHSRSTTTAATVAVRLFDGAASLAGTTQYHPSIATVSMTIPVTTLITVTTTTTVTLQAVTNYGASTTFMKAVGVYGAAPKATELVAVRLSP